VPWQRLCDDDLWDGEMASFAVGAEEILVVKHQGQYCAFQGICPHQSVALVEGELANGVLTCRAHLWQFDARTGRGINPASASLRRYPVRLAEGELQVDLATEQATEQAAQLADTNLEQRGELGAARPGPVEVGR
jgi:nitrite reductase/ring-hydroxylating ferredoxin subunit